MDDNQAEQRPFKQESETEVDEADENLNPTQSPGDIPLRVIQVSGSVDLPGDGRSATMNADGKDLAVKHKFFVCCQRTRLAHCPIDTWKLTYTDNKKTGKPDAHLEIVFVPEAFRMWFYYGWWIFIFLSIWVSLQFSTTMDLEDNVFKEHYNSVSPCIFFDYPPFSFFGAILWMPQIFTLISFELLDQFRVYDAYHEQQVSKSFYRWYTVGTIFEICAIISFIQTMATGPDEQWQIHSGPYLLMIYALWSIAFKRLLYMRAMGKLEAAVAEGKRCAKLKLYGGYIYVALMLITVILKTGVLWPNWAGAKLWTIEGMFWTDVVLQYSVYMWFFLVMLVPIFIYWILTEKLDKVRILLDRIE